MTCLAGSVTHMSGTNCHLCLGPLNLPPQELGPGIDNQAAFASGPIRGLLEAIGSA